MDYRYRFIPTLLAAANYRIGFCIAPWVSLRYEYLSWRASQRSDLLISCPGIDSGGAGQHGFSWQLHIYTSNLTFSPIHFLWLNPDKPNNFSSHYFNITDPAQTSSSIGSSAASMSLTSSMISTIANSMSSMPSQRISDTTSTNPSPPSPTSASPSTETVKLGLGVGLEIGIPLVLIAGVWIGVKLVKQSRSSSTGTSSDVPLTQVADSKFPPDSYPTPNEALYYADQAHEAVGGSHVTHEVSGEIEPVELGSRDSWQSSVAWAYLDEFEALYIDVHYFCFWS